jgi:poly-gamma-glutamate capsule biosynthesis protein CapA/YwtB (metallophosphatase superfamily)
MLKFRLILIFLTLGFSVSAQDTTRLSLLFVGDIMQHDSNIAAALDPILHNYDYSACFEYVAPVLRSADLTIGNLELTLAGPPFKGYPQFSAPDALAVELKRIGFDVLVTANNHSLDRRRKGVERTIKVLDSLEMPHTGTFRDSLERTQVYPLLVKRNGFQLSLLNYTYGTNGIPVTKPNVVNLIDTVTIKIDLAKARTQQSDAIIVFMHWGAEYQSLPNAEQKRLASLCLREGAKLVIGAHPHVLQPMIWNQTDDQLIAYSLGNFVSGQRPRYRDGGAMLWIDLQKIKRDSISITSIKNAEYELEWVKKSNDKFVMMPFRYFEGDTLFIKEKIAQEAFALFAKDSRDLFGKHNINVLEKHHSVKDTMIYSIRLQSASVLDSSALEDPVIKFYGIERMDMADNQSLLLAGTFYEYEVAQQALLEILNKTSFRRARIIRRVDLEATKSSPTAGSKN